MVSSLLSKILTDVKVELTDEFDKNFSRGGFFNQKWARKKNGQDSHLIKTGTLRRSIPMGAKIQGNTIYFTSSEKYAKVHNEGGRIDVKRRTKKRGTVSYSFNMPKRQFIGWHPNAEKSVKTIVVKHVNKYLEDYIKKTFKK